MPPMADHDPWWLWAGTLTPLSLSLLIYKTRISTPRGQPHDEEQRAALSLQAVSGGCVVSRCGICIPMLAVEGIVKGLVAPTWRPQPESPLLATVSAPCVQLEVRQLGSREGGAQSTCPSRLWPTLHPPPTQGREAG